MYCSKCGKENNNSDNYCKYCGEKLQSNINKVESNFANNLHKDKLIIKQNPNGNTTYIVGTLIFVLIGLWILLMGYEIFSSSILNFIIKLAALADVMFFGYCMLFYIKRNQENKDLVIVDKNGITDNSSVISVGFIPWEDINEIYINSILSNKFILVKLKNEDKYLNKSSFFKQKAMLENRKMGYEIIDITLNSTGVQPEKFLQEILEYRESIEIKQ